MTLYAIALVALTKTLARATRFPMVVFPLILSGVGGRVAFMSGVFDSHSVAHERPSVCSTPSEEKEWL